MTALLSPGYLAEQRRMHAVGGYGAHGDKWADVVAKAALALRARSVLDYGCGQGQLVARVAEARPEIPVRGYDPAVEAWAAPPRPADLVVCADVLEHVEPDRLRSVLAHLARLTRLRLFLVVATRPSSKWLPDGRNAHLIVALPHFWEAQVGRAGWQAAERVKTAVHRPALEWMCLLRRPA